MICQWRAGQLLFAEVCETLANHDILRSPSPIIIVLTFDHRSFDQLNMSNHSLPTRGTNPPFSYKSIVSITHEQNIICSKTLFCRLLFTGDVVSSQPMKRIEKIH